MGHVFVDYFRCPAHLTHFDTAGALPTPEGYFSFSHIPCYGRLAGGPLADEVHGELTDASRSASSAGGRTSLPFDLSEVVTNLRLERYRLPPESPVQSLIGSAPSRATYYALRPFMPVGVRRHLQKLRLHGWEQIPFPSWPVDASVDALMKAAMALVLSGTGGGRLPFIWFWPEGAPACVMMTHDVEGPAGATYCARLMDLDESLGIRASYQIVPESPDGNPRSLLATIRRRGFEVNLHDLSHDGYLFHEKARFLERAAVINRYARDFNCGGFRAAAMYRRQEWFDAFDFSFDMSVPSVAHLEPQRGGCCTVMPYFVGDLLELPLTTTQDYSLFHVLGDYSIGLWRRQMDVILEHHGLLSFIVHPDYLMMSPGAMEVYTELLGALVALRDEQRVWMATPSEIDRWWRHRRRMSLVPDGAGWRIEGPDHERARVAYATLAGDRVVYTMDTSAPLPA